MTRVARHGGPLLGAVVTVIVLRSVAAQTGARPETGPESFGIAQGVLVQLTSSPTLYLPSPSTGIDAVDVGTGKVRWHDSLAAVPLWARGNRLLVLATRVPGHNDARLAFLDTESGSIVAERPTLEIPGWGPLTYLGGRGSEAWFALEGRSKGGRDFLVWHYRKQRRVQGATPPPPPKPVTEREQEDSGVVEVDLASATVGPANETFGNRTLAFKRDAAGGSEWGPFEIDGVRVTLVRVVGKRVTTLFLRRRRGGRLLPDILVSRSREACSFFASLDWHDVLSWCQVAGAHDPFLYAVTVYAAANGQKVGHIVLDTSPSVFVAWHGKLLYFFPWHVGLADLGSGEQLFDRPTRDISYFELPPP